MIRPPHRSPPTDTLFPYPTLFRSHPEPRRPFPWRAPFPAFSRAVSVLPCALQQPLARFVPLPAPSVPILRVPPCHLVFCRSSVLVRAAPSCRYPHCPEAARQHADSPHHGQQDIAHALNHLTPLPPHQHTPPARGQRYEAPHPPPTPQTTTPHTPPAGTEGP